jgi:protein phosphatase 2C-like protein
MTETDVGDWLLAWAKVPGKSHIDRGTPCQDDCKFRFTRDGRWIAAVVCDGAGSAIRAREGAQIVADSVSESLILETTEVDKFGPQWLDGRMHQIISRVRDELRSTGRIEDFNCTLVAMLLGPNWGRFYHIGDGAALSSKVYCDDEGGEWRSPRVKLWNDLVISEPENGEYANETFFVSDENWREHLRVRPLPQDMDIVVLMSDGGMPFVLQQGQPYSPFIDPIICALLKIPTRRDRDALLNKYLASEETYPTTSDDKTLFIAMRSNLKGIVDYDTIQKSQTSPSSLDGDALKNAKPREAKRATVEQRDPKRTGQAATATRKDTQPVAVLAAVALILALVSLTSSALMYIRLDRIRHQLQTMSGRIANQERLNRPRPK